MVDNSVTRLKEMLFSLKEHEHDNLTTRQAWCKVLNIEVKDKAKFLYSMAEVLHLVEAVREEIQSLEGITTEIYLKPIITIEKHLTAQTFEEKVHSLFGSINSVLDFLPFCEDLLKQRKGEIQISEEELLDLQQEAEALSNQVMLSNLPVELKRALVDKLEKIRFAIVNFRLNGLDGLKNELESSMGMAIIYGDQISHNRETDAVKGFFGIIDKLGKIVSLGKDTVALISPVFQHLIGK